MATETTNYGLKKPASSDTVDISVLNGNMDTLDSELDKASKAIALIERGDTATQNIAKGQYVLWKGVLTQASEAITSGDALSASNLTTVSGGAMNCLSQAVEITAATGYTITRNGSVRHGNTLLLDLQITKDSGNFAQTWTTVATISGYSKEVTVMAINCMRGADFARIEISTIGEIRAYASGGGGNAVYLNMIIGE